MVISSAETAAKTWTPTATSSFLTAQECNAVIQSFKDIVEVSARATGGYALAERKRVVFEKRPDYVVEPVEGEDDGEYIAAADIQGA
jgi:RNA-binding protein YlmH